MAWPLVGLFITGDVYALPEARTQAEQVAHRGSGVGVNPCGTVPKGTLALGHRRKVLEAATEK